MSKWVDWKCRKLICLSSFLKHDVDPQSDAFPNPIRCSIEKLNDNGAYLLGMYNLLTLNL